MNQEDLARLHREAEEELGRYPGVVGVAYGEKRRGGEPTGEVGFCVYVQEKKPLDQLTPEETLPTEYRGIPVDVDQVPDATRVAECQDRVIHSPLIGGITISNLNPIPTGGYPVGTLGCFATLNGVDPPDNVVALTNHHVAMAQGAAVGDTIYQPRKVPLPTGQLAVDLDNRNPIGKIEHKGEEKNVRFAYPNEAEDDYFVDCSSVRINISISSWCDTNCGESIRNEIRGLNVLGANAIADVARVVQADIPPPPDAYTVVKVGSRTSRTEGRVSRLNVPMLHGEKNVIEITATANNCEGNLMFVDQQDSGSALINAQAKVIGLVFGVDTADPSLAYACHIHPVLDQLKVTAITNQHPPDPRVTRSDADLVVDGRLHARALREKLLGSDEGRRIAAIVEQHRHEVVRLVNTNRRVTVAWRRNQGPAFLNRAIANANDPAVAIPREIEAVRRETLLRAMDRALTEHGSPALRAVIDQHRDALLAHVDAFDSLHDVVDLIAHERELA